jgi:hypothetical protein
VSGVRCQEVSGIRGKVRFEGSRFKVQGSGFRVTLIRDEVKSNLYAEPDTS